VSEPDWRLLIVEGQPPSLTLQRAKEGRKVERVKLRGRHAPFAELRVPEQGADELAWKNETKFESRLGVIGVSFAAYM